MAIFVEPYTKEKIIPAIKIWNEVVREGVAFPQENELDEVEGDKFFSAQSFTGLAVDDETGEILAIYILHPNNVGRCGHISNASYAVKKNLRGKHIGEKIVTHCIKKARELGFKILQAGTIFNICVKFFNAVLKSARKRLRHKTIFTNSRRFIFALS